MSFFFGILLALGLLSISLLAEREGGYENGRIVFWSQRRFLFLLEPYFRIYPIMCELSQNFLLDLYLSKPNTVQTPLLQLLGFQQSEHNLKEIIVRLSDGTTFFDATLLGPYELTNGRIVVTPFSASHGSAQAFQKYDLVKLTDFFSKVDDTKICRLKMMIRKIAEARTCDRKIGRPEDLAFSVQAGGLIKEDDRARQQREEWILTHRPIEQPRVWPEEDQKQTNKLSVISKELQILGINRDRNPDEPLTCREIFNGCEGFFIGRLLRMKPTLKENKGVSTQMLALGFLDSAGEMLRLNLLGKLAVREEKQLKLGRCYYVKGLEVVQTRGAPYVKLREKDYRLHLLAEDQAGGKFGQEYYHWEHEHDYIENEMVDIVGVVEDIEEKTNYGVKEVGDHQQVKEVIRVVLRNRFKTVKVNFWSDQLKNLSRLNLKKGEVVIVQDVRKKKLVFLDFSVESTVVRLQPESEAYLRVANLLPEQHDYAQPINVACIYGIQELQKYSTKVHIINAQLLRLQEEKVIFKMCDLCKKKININSAKCFECKGTVMSYKYNTNIEFGDYSGSIWLAVYDSIAEKLFGLSALRFKELKETPEDYEDFEYSLFYKSYQIGIQIKSERFILRTIEPIQNQEITDWCKDSLSNIHKLQEKSETS